MNLTLRDWLTQTARFALLDTNGDGKIKRSELPRIHGRTNGSMRSGTPPEREDMPTGE